MEPVIAEAHRAILEDHAEAIILGCAGLQPLVEPLSLTLGVPVIEGVAAAVKLVEALLAMRLATSKRGAWGYPLQPPGGLPGGMR
jgi:allantoin racemase